MQSTSAWSSTSGRLTYRYCRGRGIASRRALESHPCTAAQRKNTRRVEPYERRGPSFFSILVELANVLWRNPAEFGDAGGLQVLGECRQLLDVLPGRFRRQSAMRMHKQQGIAVPCRCLWPAKADRVPRGAGRSAAIREDAGG